MKSIHLLLILFLSFLMHSCSSGFPDCRNPVIIGSLQMNIIYELRPNMITGEVWANKGNILLTNIRETGQNDGGMFRNEFSCYCKADFEYKETKAQVEYEVRNKGGKVELRKVSVLSKK